MPAGNKSHTLLFPACVVEEDLELSPSLQGVPSPHESGTVSHPVK